MRILTLTIIVLIAASHHCLPQPLDGLIGVGAKAPPLHIAAWFNGDTIVEFKNDEVYIVEFSGTWCTPCRKAIPHLSALSQEYLGKITVISVYLEDNNPDSPANLSYIDGVEKFVYDMGEKIRFTVAVDVPQQTTKKSWQITGIPRAFVVKNGTIVWDGLPEKMDHRLLDEVLAESGDLATLMKEEHWFDNRLSKIFALIEKCQFKTAQSSIDSLIEACPAKKHRLDFIKFANLVNYNYEESYRWLEHLLISDPIGFNWSYLCEFFTKIPSGKRNFQLDLKAIDKAIEKAETIYYAWHPLSIKAATFAEMGKYPQAVETAHLAFEYSKSPFGDKVLSQLLREKLAIYIYQEKKVDDVHVAKFWLKKEIQRDNSILNASRVPEWVSIMTTDPNPDFDLALEFVDMVIAKTDNDIIIQTLWASKAKIYSKAGESSLAHDWVDRAIAEARQSGINLTEHLLCKASIYEDFGLLPEAANLYRTAIAAETDKAQVSTNAGISQFHLKRAKEYEQRLTNILIELEADQDWQELMKMTEDAGFPSDAILDSALHESGVVGYHLAIDEHMRKKLDLAEAIWNRYPDDARRMDALYIYLGANGATLLPWLYDISPDSLETLNMLYNELTQTSKQTNEIHPGRRYHGYRKYFRSLPRDHHAYAQWKGKGDSMVHLAHTNPAMTLEKKERLDWALFTRDWRSASFAWKNLPKDDEQPSDRINVLEEDYWQDGASHFWEALWIRFNEHVVKYPESSIIAERALDFLAGTKQFAPFLVTAYWQKLVSIYAEMAHPLAEMPGVQALVAVARAQIGILAVETGDAPLEMAFEAMNGKVVNLEHLRGKIVLIDFWASWCKPCLAEIPHLKAMNEKYGEMGFEIIGINMDDAHMLEQIEELLIKEGVNWPQRFEGKGFANDTYRLKYGINALPTVWLLDKAGKIVDGNARGKELESLIQEQLGLR